MDMNPLNTSLYIYDLNLIHNLEPGQIMCLSWNKNILFKKVKYIFIFKKKKGEEKLFLKSHSIGFLLS